MKPYVSEPQHAQTLSVSLSVSSTRPDLQVSSSLLVKSLIPICRLTHLAPDVSASLYQLCVVLVFFLVSWHISLAVAFIMVSIISQTPSSALSSVIPWIRILLLFLSGEKLSTPHDSASCAIVFCVVFISLTLLWCNFGPLTFVCAGHSSLKILNTRRLHLNFLRHLTSDLRSVFTSEWKRWGTDVCRCLFTRSSHHVDVWTLNGSPVQTAQVEPLQTWAVLPCFFFI